MIKSARTYRFSSIITFFIMISLGASAQNNTAGIPPSFTLPQCIDYAMQHQPALKQSLIDVSIAKTTNAINLSGWLPQLNLTGSMTHYFQLPSTLVQNPANPEGPLLREQNGIINTAIPALSATETLFSPDLLFAAKSAHLYVQQATQATDSSKINLIASVSKSYYSLLNTLQQINLFKEDTTRLGKNLRDTYHQYIGGIVDKTDYEEATITLNNSKAQLKQAYENVRPQYALLKQLMGSPAENQFNVSFDTVQMMQEITFDTTLQLQYDKRIEYQQLQTAKNLQHQLTNYYRLDFLPSLSAFYNYAYEYESDNLSTIFAHAYPYSLVGFTVDVPLFTGFRRVKSVQKAKLQENRIEWDEVNLKARIYSEYSSAFANYKSNVYNLQAMQDNVTLAKDVYGIVSLQYKQGIVAYLNVITAESNLMTSESNYLNALFQVLSSKIDLKKAMGDIAPKP